MLTLSKENRPTWRAGYNERRIIAIPELVYPRSTGAESPFVLHLNAGLKACSSTVADTVIVELL